MQGCPVTLCTRMVKRQCGAISLSKLAIGLYGVNEIFDNTQFGYGTQVALYRLPAYKVCEIEVEGAQSLPAPILPL